MLQALRRCRRAAPAFSKVGRRRLSFSWHASRCERARNGSDLQLLYFPLGVGLVNSQCVFARYYCAASLLSDAAKESGGSQQTTPPRDQERKSEGVSAINPETNVGQKASPFDSASATRTPRRREKKKFIPRRAAISLTPKARTFFGQLLSATTNPDVVGIMLRHQQSSSGEPRMVFTFSFVKEAELTSDDEGVSLEVLDDGETPKPPAESWNDGLPKLYVHRDAFLKILGAKLDVDIDRNTGAFTPLLYDKEGNKMDPNA